MPFFNDDRNEIQEDSSSIYTVAMGCFFLLRHSVLYRVSKNIFVDNFVNGWSYKCSTFYKTLCQKVCAQLSFISFPTYRSSHMSSQNTMHFRFFPWKRILMFRLNRLNVRCQFNFSIILSNKHKTLINKLFLFSYESKWRCNLGLYDFTLKKKK